MIEKEVFEEMKKDYKKYGEVLKIDYFDDYIDGTRYIFKVEGDKLIVYIKDDVEEIEVSFIMDIDFIIHFSLEECIKEFNEYYYYAPNVYEE